ncbi:MULTISPECIES: hypothetical protein [Cytobacillus]|uniref:hypothetical protein n=1 Tax=Cytobacillus TaxID=2675230 RepID=UPI0020403D66|nr:hypothetical protein [Cytobacillus firmus]MCM3707662.1 hypothetical protein [Cytobacillus firmus]
MNRKEKYRRIRIGKRVNLSKYSLLGISISSLFLFSLFIMSFGTYAYFNAQYKNEFNIRNATKEELVQITEGPVEYEDKCKAKQTVTVKNIFDYKVVISIDNSEYILQPGEAITHSQILADGCGEFGDKSFKIIGYENYFVHPVNAVVEKKMLNPKPPCPPQSDNGQGKPNDNGKGKQCGHTDTNGGTSVPEESNSNEENKVVTKNEEKQGKDTQQETEKMNTEASSDGSTKNENANTSTDIEETETKKESDVEVEQEQKQEEEQAEQQAQVQPEKKDPVTSEEPKKEQENSSTEDSAS